MRAIGIIVLAMLVLLVGGPVSGQGLATLRVIGPPNDGFTPIYVGVKNGIFKKYGLDVQPSIVQSGSAAAAALIGGSADIAATNTLTMIQARAGNIPLQYLSPGGTVSASSTFIAALVLSDSPIATARDVSGKIVASSSIKDINAAAFLAWVDQNGGDTKTVKQLEVPASSAVAMLESHRADVVVLTQPAVGQALASGKVRVLINPYAAFSTPVDPAGFAVLASSVVASPDIYARFAKAFHEASTYTNTHLAETVDIVASFSGATPEQVAHSSRIITADSLDPRRLQPLIDVCAKYGLIAKGFSAQDIISPAALKPPR